MEKMLGEILEQPDVLMDCAEKNEAEISNIISDIKSREIDNIIFAARGSSDNACIYGKYLAEYITGIPVSLASPSMITVYNRKLRLERSLIIGISQSGEARDVLSFIKHGNECGAITVAITNTEDSPLDKAAGYKLRLSAGVEESVAATKTFTAEMYILGLLFAALGNERELLAKLKKVTEVIEQQLYNGSAVGEVAERYKDMKECFVLSRGVNYAIAAEAALKLQETAYIRARAYPISDFYHGPLALADKNIPFIIFAPEGPALDKSIEICHRLREIGCDIIIISNSPELRSYANEYIELPEEDCDFISPFYGAVVAQLLAAKIASLKGLDPDRPKNIRKITVTI